MSAESPILRYGNGYNCRTFFSVNKDSVDANQDVSALTDTIQRLLQLSPWKLRKVLEGFSPDRVYELCECARFEGYDKMASLSDRFDILALYAEELHVQGMVQENYIANRKFRMLLLDVDETLAEVLEPPSEEMCAELIFQLEQGAHIGILTAQPLQDLERGLLAALRSLLSKQGKSLGLLQAVHLFPIYTVLAYSIDANGEVNRSCPVYNLGFTDEHYEAMQTEIETGDVGKKAKEYFFCGYISIHWKTEEDLSWGRVELTKILNRFAVPGRVVRRKATRKVLHIFPSSINKAIGRNYMLRVVRAELNTKIGDDVSRSEILVAGDRMGVSDGENDDSNMQVFGGINLALGKEAISGAYKSYMHQKVSGLLSFLRANRAYLEGQMTDEARS